MARDFSGHDEDRVEAERVRHGVRMGGEPILRRVDDAGLLARGHRFGGGVEICARLHLDEDQRAAAARDDVDLADRRLEAGARMR